MIGAPIDLDARRDSAARRQSELRRRPANAAFCGLASGQPQPGRLEGQVLARPARTWHEAVETWRCLLAETSGADDDRIQRLIQRALGDAERLRHSEERP